MKNKNKKKLYRVKVTRVLYVAAASAKKAKEIAVKAEPNEKEMNIVFSLASVKTFKRDGWDFDCLVYGESTWGEYPSDYIGGNK